MLEVRGLHVTRGGKAVVHGVDLDVGRGEIVALLGPNGAGKSSTVLALAGAIPRTQGSVRLGGIPGVGMVDIDGPTGGAGFVTVAKLAGVTASLTAGTDWLF